MKDSLKVKSKKKGYGPPFDTTNRWFKYTYKNKDFLFDEIESDAMRLKSIPIELRR